jgi:hypothetical protein
MVFSGDQAGPFDERTELPLAIIEIGDTHYEVESAGAEVYEATTDLLISFVWSEQDSARTFTERSELPDLIVGFAARNRTLGDAAGAFWLEDALWEVTKEPIVMLTCPFKALYERRG